MAIILSSTETSNRDWSYQFEVIDDETGDLVDLTGAVIAIEISDADGRETISATTENGKISIVSTGVFTMDIPYSETNICAGTYSIGGYYQLNGETLDLIDGSIAVRTGRPIP
jgi:hypothetical protein